MIQKIITLLSLVRWKNLLIILLVQILIRYCLLGSIYKDAGIAFGLPLIGFMLLTLSTMLIAAGGYVINDFFDVRIDRINKPDKQILTRKIPLKQAPVIHLYLTISGLLAAAGAAWYAGSIKLIGFQAAVAAVLWFYSSKYKRSFLSGNLIIALATAMVPAIVWLFEFYALKQQPVKFSAVIPYFGLINRTVLIYSGLAFLINLAREIIKDIIDMKGDQLYGCKSLPLACGTKRTIYIISGLLLLLLILIGVFLPYNWNGTPWNLFFYLPFVALGPILVITMLIFKTPTAEQLHTSEKLLKFTMLAGMLNLLFFCLK